MSGCLIIIFTVTAPTAQKMGFLPVKWQPWLMLKEVIIVQAGIVKKGDLYKVTLLPTRVRT